MSDTRIDVNTPEIVWPGWYTRIEKWATDPNCPATDTQRHDALWFLRNYRQLALALRESHGTVHDSGCAICDTLYGRDET